MIGNPHVLLTLVLAANLTAVQAGGAATLSNFDPAQVSLGDQVYRQFCQRCHGTELRNSGTSTFDLRLFPVTEYDRFIESVNEGYGDMPPHGDVLTGEEIDALFAYVVASRAGQK
jgi:mono/diheme cytochrome c family protein